MCALNKIDKTSVDAIGFHGKTLDHNPPSKARKEKTQPYTLQIGSGQMLADLTGIPLISAAIPTKLLTVMPCSEKKAG